jgi:hypothetical protein
MLAISIPAKREASAGDHFFSCSPPTGFSIANETDKMMPDVHALRSIIDAVNGWFDLGNYVEAFNELDKLPPKHRASNEAMGLRCCIYRKLERWQELEIVAAGCSGRKIEQIPFACHHTWALLMHNRPLEALAALEKVPYTCAPELLFSRACVLCALGEVDQSRNFLSDAIIFSIDSNAMKLRALGEPMLARIWADDNEHQS